MFIRAYLRASTSDQDAQRARTTLADFTAYHKKPIAAWYGENASGTSVERQELQRLLSDASPGDVLLVETIDRLTRADHDGWQRLRKQIEDRRLRIVALDVPTSHMALQGTTIDDFTASLLDSINRMMIDMLAAIARKDWENRRRVTQQGIAKAVAQGKYKGRPPDYALHARIKNLLNAKKENGKGFSIRDIARILECSPTTVKKVKAADGAS